MSLPEYGLEGIEDYTDSNPKNNTWEEMGHAGLLVLKPVCDGGYFAIGLTEYGRSVRRRLKTN